MPEYTGLNDAEVNASRLEHGVNSFPDSSRGSLRIFIDVIREPMMVLLVVACAIYFFTGEISEGMIMLAAIGIVSSISIFQEIRSENALRELHKLTQPLTLVIRDAKNISIRSEELVVGDIMIISEGQHVAADASILDSNDCSVNESILTGESFPVTKGESDPLLYAGTSLVSGLANARVTAVGLRSRIGQLGKSMEDIRKEKTPLQMQVSIFVRQMAWFGAIAFVFVWMYNYYDSGNLLHGLMHGLTLAMAALPEEIPVALSTFMALGAYRLIRHHVLAKHPQTVESLGSATVICVDKTGTITENKMTVTTLYDQAVKKIIRADEAIAFPSSRELLDYALFACEPQPFDPMEHAIHEAAQLYGNKVRTVDYRMIHEYPLSGVHPMMTHIYEGPGGQKIVACKGAPEGIIQSSTLSSAEQTEILLKVKELATMGYRVLGVAKTDFPEAGMPEEQTQFKWTFLGLVALSDPPKKNIEVVVRQFYDAGIGVKMITGDFPQTAATIAMQSGLKQTDRMITGKEVMEMNNDQILQAVKDTNIFARMMPEAKLRVINALKENGEVVAMTGDGVNDGPALKSAHIGIAMGKRGSEIARQAASLVLLDDDLGSMVSAIALGRKIYSNLKKAFQYIISIHIPLISIVTLPLILGWKYPNIFSPIHIIFLELVMGPTCSIVFENEPMEKDAMLKLPRKFSSSFFTWRELSMSVLQGLVITGGLMFILFYSIHNGLDENSSRTMVFFTLVASNILLTLTGRSRHETIVTTLQYKNRLVPIVIFTTSLILVLSLWVGPVRDIFQFANLTSHNLIICLITALVSVIWIEIYKPTIKYFLASALFILLLHLNSFAQSRQLQSRYFPQKLINRSLGDALENSLSCPAKQISPEQDHSITSLLCAKEKLSPPFISRMSHSLVNDTLFVGLVPNDTVRITGTWVNNGPVFVFNDGVLIFDHANSTILGDVFVWGIGRVFADSSSFYFPQQYFYQRSWMVIQQGYMQMNACSFNYGGWPHNLLISDTASVYLNNIFNNDWTTAGIYSHGLLHVNGENLAGEYILTQWADVQFRNTTEVILWHQFPDSAVINYSFPQGDTVVSYTFNNTMTGVNGIGYSVQLDSCYNVMWALMPVNGSDITISNSVIRAIGVWFTAGDTVTISGLVNNSMYTSFTAPLPDRNLVLNTCSVSVWSTYIFDSSFVSINGCILGEVGSMGHSRVQANGMYCDGSGGYFWAADTSLTIASSVSVNSTVRSEKNGFMIFGYGSINNGTANSIGHSLLIVVQSSVSQDPNASDGSVAWFQNIEQPAVAYADSVANITGSAWIDQGPQGSFMYFNKYSVYFKQQSATSWIPIDTGITNEVRHSTLANWNTHGLTAGSYLLRLLVFNTFGDSVEAIKMVNLLPAVLNNLTAINLNESFLVYPNPSQGEFMLKSDAFQTSTHRFELFELSGKYLKELLPSGFCNTTGLTRFNEPGLKPGIYWIKIISDSGNSVVPFTILNSR